MSQQDTSTPDTSNQRVTRKRTRAASAASAAAAAALSPPTTTNSQTTEPAAAGPSTSNSPPPAAIEAVIPTATPAEAPATTEDESSTSPPIRKRTRNSRSATAATNTTTPSNNTATTTVAPSNNVISTETLSEAQPAASTDSSTAVVSAPAALIPETVNPLKFEAKRIIVGTLNCMNTSYISVHQDGIMLHIETEKEERAEVLLKFDAFFDYLVCDSAALPVMIIRGNTAFGDAVRGSIPSLKKTDSQDLSNHIYDPFSPDKCHWYVIIELTSASSLCDLIAKLMQNNITSSIASGRLMMPKSILAEDAKKKINATQTITLKWKELQLGTWKSQLCPDSTVHISGSRIKFKAKTATGEVTLAIHLAEVNSISICTAQVQPVLFVRASETFGWSARDRLGISSTFQQGKNYYNPDSPETRFKFVTFKLDKQGLARDTWQRMIDLSGERFFMIDPISARNASDMLHKLTYEPISCTSVRVGANELDEIRAVTIHFDSICICGCMLDSVVTMNICIADIKEISLCTNEKSPVLFVKTSTAISDTLKKNMSNRSADVFFDPTSKDIRTQYIVIELVGTTTKETLKKIQTTLQTVLNNFHDRINIPKAQRANVVNILQKKKTTDLLTRIKEPLPAKECTCGKKEDKKTKEEVKEYVQTMTAKHGCEAFEKIATRAVELTNKIRCSVCLDKDCQIVFSCGHMICERCDQSLRKCHICRMKILRRVRVFI